MNIKNLISLLVATILIAACGGGGGGGEAPPQAAVTAPTPTKLQTRPGASPFSPIPASVTAANTVPVSGAITYDYVPVKVAAAAPPVPAQPYLDFAATERRPARAVVVEMVNASTLATLASTRANANGVYSLLAPPNTSVFVRAYAVLVPNSANTTDIIEVLDNTQGDALWVLDSAPFTPNATASVAMVSPSIAGAPTSTLTVKNLHAPLGWSTASATYTGVRGAAPFAILDTIYNGLEKIRTADPNVIFPKLSVHWSPNNSTAPGDRALGQIGSAFFTDSVVAGVVQRDMYLRGKENNNTDEFDAHVITHELGHYLQSAFSRDDSIGGRHGGFDDKLDMRLAFSEGWGYAWAAIALNDNISTDTVRAAAKEGLVFDVAAGEIAAPNQTRNPGWFKESSVQRVLWDISKDTSLGFTPIWQVLKKGLTQSEALTGIHSFAYALSQISATYIAPLRTILARESIALPTDAFGAGETNFGTPVIANLSPIYTPITLGQISNVCMGNAADTRGAGNKAGEYRYLRLTVPATADRTVKVTRSANTSFSTTPAFFLYDKSGQFGGVVASIANSAAGNGSLDAGNYVLAVTDRAFVQNTAIRTTCFDVLVN